MHSDVLILGGGPAGMAAAMELSRAGRTCTVVEKANQVGGLAKTLVFQEPDGIYRTDIGPHRFYSKNKYLYDFIEDLLGEEWITVHRQTRFLVDGKYYFYPIRLGNVLRHVGLRGSARILSDYLKEHIRAVFHPPRILSFEDYAVSKFGRALAEFNMLNYTEKIWGIPCSGISIDWALQRIGGLSIWSTLKKAVFGTSGPKTLVDTFYYPSHGSGQIYETIRERIEQKGSRVLTNTQPQRLRWSNRRVHSVEMTGQSNAVMEPSCTVSSLPITECVKLFDPLPPTEVCRAAESLRFRSQIYLFLTINREHITQDNWIYFPDKEIPFGRLSEMKNFSETMCPLGKTFLFVEYFCFEGDDVWNMSKDAISSLTIQWLETLGFIKKSEVLSTHRYRQAHVYPLYDLMYRTHLQTILTWMDQFENFYAIGRPGRFRYTNQDHSLEMGILAARSILDGRRHNIEDVGKEQEYFERGFTPSR